MARRKSSAKPKTTAKAEVEETTTAVVVTYHGFKLPPESPPEKRRRHCDRCGWGPARSSDRYACSDTGHFFQCQRCVDPNTGRPNRWKEPLGS